MKKAKTILLTIAAATTMLTGCTKGENQNAGGTETPVEMSYTELMTALEPYSNKWFYSCTEKTFRRVKIEKNYLFDEISIGNPDVKAYVYLIKNIDNEYRAYSFTNNNTYRTFELTNGTIKYGNATFTI